MKEDAEYHIKIKNPRAGVASHISSLFYYKDGVPTRFNDAEKAAYLHKRKKVLKFADDTLDFHTSYERTTKLVFTISHPNYEFAAMPIVVNRAIDRASQQPVAGSSLEFGQRKSKKRAEILIEGASTKMDIERKYSLVYIYKGPNGEEELFVFDPVILNGEDNPAPPQET